jgi:4-hydroxy-3-methylbut-2-enyl diphosphate reductase
MEVIKFSREGRECILIGHAGHPEVEGTMGQFDTSRGGVMKLVEDEDDALDGRYRRPKNRILCHADHPLDG